MLVGLHEFVVQDVQPDRLQKLGPAQSHDLVARIHAMYTLVFSFEVFRELGKCCDI